jgi:hypothetical protein
MVDHRCDREGQVQLVVRAMKPSLFAFLAIVAGCGTKAADAVKLPDVIQYELVVNNPPKSDHSFVRFSIRLNGTLYKVGTNNRVRVDFPSHGSIPKQKTSIVVEGDCKSTEVQATGAYLSELPDAASEKKYLAESVKRGEPVLIYFTLPAGVAEPYLLPRFPARFYIDWGDATSTLKVGDHIVPRGTKSGSFTPDCDGLPITLDGKTIATYRATSEDFARTNTPSGKEPASGASLFVAMDPARCYRYATRWYGRAGFGGDQEQILRGGVAHLIDASEIEFFLFPAPAEVTEAASLDQVVKHEILPAPCR